jgi:hypothetical protein
MKKEKEYSEHVKECWTFSQRLAKEIAVKENKDQPSNLEFSIFDKCCSPYYYFIQNDEQKQTPQPPSEEQIAYSKHLGIKDPEKFSKKQLSVEIEKAVQKNKESQGVK